MDKLIADDNGAEAYWPILGSAVNCAISLGLHRDGEPFGLAEHEVIERRKVLWELAIQERLQALCFARPSSLLSRFTDTQRPGSESRTSPDVTAFHDAKFQIADIIERVIETQTRIGPGPYSVIIQLDHDLTSLQRQLPTSLLATISVSSLPMQRTIHPHLVIQRLVLRVLICICRLYLHRPSFARALQENQEDPSATKFGQSFTALYESAFEMVNSYKQLIVYHPSLVARYHFLHFHTFSAAVCLSAIAIKAPRCAFATPALHGMVLVTDLCLAAHDTSRAKIGLPILLRLRQSAFTIMSNTLGNNRPFVRDDGREDDLSHLAENNKLRRLQETSPQMAMSSPNWSIATDQASSHQYASSHCRDDSLHSATSFASVIPSTTAPTLTPWFGQESSQPTIQPLMMFGDAIAYSSDLYLGPPPESYMLQGSMDHLHAPVMADEAAVHYKAYAFDLDTFMMQLEPRSN